MSSILTRLGSRLLHEVADRGLGGLHGHGGAGQRGVGQEPVHGAFEVAAVGGDRAGDVGRPPPALTSKPGCAARTAASRAERIEARSCSSSVADLDHEAAGEARAHALVQGSRARVGGRSAATTTWRPASISALRVWPNSCLDRLALDELHVVDDQQVDAAQALLEGERGLRLQGGDEAVHEAVGGEVDHPPAGLAARRGRCRGAGGSCRGRRRHGSRAGCRARPAPSWRATRSAAAWARAFERPTTKLSKVRRLSSGAPLRSPARPRARGRVGLRPGRLVGRRRGMAAPTAWRRARGLAGAAAASARRRDGRTAAAAPRTPTVDARDRLDLAAEGVQHPVEVMRLDPALQEAGRHREAGACRPRRRPVRGGRTSSRTRPRRAPPAGGASPAPRRPPYRDRSRRSCRISALPDTLPSTCIITLLAPRAEARRRNVRTHTGTPREHGRGAKIGGSQPVQRRCWSI